MEHLYLKGPQSLAMLPDSWTERCSRLSFITETSRHPKAQLDRRKVHPGAGESRFLVAVSQLVGYVTLDRSLLGETVSSSVNGILFGLLEEGLYRQGQTCDWPLS